jgi:hypothetical protein
MICNPASLGRVFLVVRRADPAFCFTIDPILALLMREETQALN